MSHLAGVTSEARIPNVVLVGRPDVFIGSQDLQKLFVGVADYLSLWCWRYGLRAADLRTSSLGMIDDHTFFFRVYDRFGQAVHPMKYDPRMEEPDFDMGGSVFEGQDRPFASREARIMWFITQQPWFRDKLREVDRKFLAYLTSHKLEATDVEVVNRWTDTGMVIMRFIWRSTPATSNRYQTHLKYMDEPGGWTAR